MNIEQARSLSLEAFIKRLGHQEIRKGNDREAWFLSPLRNEKTASFKVDRRHNKWIDFGDGAKGDIIDFVQAYGPRRGWGTVDVSEALQRIEGIVGALPRQAPTSTGRGFPIRAASKQPKQAEEVDTYRIDRIGPVQEMKLIDYLRSRKLHVNTAKEYLQQIHYTHQPSNRQFYGLTWGNESGGQEVRSPYFKTAIGKKDVSVVEINHPKRVPGTAVFEGMTDYLTYLQVPKQQVMARAIIMNSASMHERVTEILQKLPKDEPKLGYLQNDKPGLKLTVKLKESVPEVQVMNGKYSAYTDLNDYLTGKPMVVADRKHAQNVLDSLERADRPSLKASKGQSTK